MPFLRFRISFHYRGRRLRHGRQPRRNPSALPPHVNPRDPSQLRPRTEAIPNPDTLPWHITPNRLYSEMAGGNFRSRDTQHSSYRYRADITAHNSPHLNHSCSTPNFSYVTQQPRIHRQDLQQRRSSALLSTPINPPSYASSQARSGDLPPPYTILASPVDSSMGSLRSGSFSRRVAY